jgi:hypothetical protein
LDVSKNTALESFACTGNQLTTLDVSKNTALTILACDGNRLTTLDVSKNTALERLYCQGNRLTTLDVSKNTALTTLVCRNNQLTTLDVSKNMALTTLVCNGNQLTTLDVSKNTALITLVCTDNRLPSKAAIIGLDESRTKLTFDPQGEAPAEDSNISGAAAWAREGIAGAIAKGFVPADIQNNYASVITRQEFCRMAVKFIEYKTGKDIDATLSERGLSRDTGAFSDTNDPDILAAYALGVTSGTGGGKFSPNGQFTREQAATMLMNTCKALGMDVSNSPTSDFTDLGSASAWAVDGINFVRVNGVMSGTSTTESVFTPKTTYTRQESIVTFDRIE